MEWSAASHIAAIIFYVIGIGLVVTSQVAVAWVGYDSVRMYGLYQRCAGSLCQNIGKKLIISCMCASVD